MTEPRMTDTQAACDALERTGQALTIAATHQTRIIAATDGYPSGGGSGRSSDTTSTTERAALHAFDADHEAHKARMAIEDMRDWWTGLRIMLADGARLAARHRPDDERHDVLLCDARPFEGSMVAWVPHSRAHNNGWSDPLCLDAADDSGLCIACARRERRWRDKNGLRPRNRNRYQDGVEPIADDMAMVG